MIAGAAGVTALPARRASAARVGLHDKVNLALIGCGGMGSRHLEALSVNPNCNLVAVCDVAMSRYYDSRKTAEELSGRRPDGYQDFREILDRQDIDAILIATPDHWHPLMAILGCEAGKDVYVEKPMSTTVEEGRAMVNAARRFGRVVQAGTQQRSMPIFHRAMEVVHSGRLGQITSATAWVGTNGMFVDDNPEELPKGLDWDLFLGPAPWAPYSPQRFGPWRVWYDYARGGELTNWGVHLMDIVHWGIGQDRPLSVQAVGGLYRGGAGSDNYEVVDAIYEYPGCTVTWEQRHSNTYDGRGYGIKFQGTEGTLLLDRESFTVLPEALGIERFQGAPELSWANEDHHNNFFHCIRTRQKPAADIEQGHRSTTPNLLAGIAMQTDRKLNWDSENEKFIDDEHANRYLTRAYRSPWRLPV
jgi:predicted dehydrogenase